MTKIPFNPKTYIEHQGDEVIVKDEQGNTIEHAKRETLAEKCERAYQQEKLEEIGFLKRIIDLTYKDGKNSKAKIRVLVNERLDEICK